MPGKFSAVDPAGEIHRRNSKTRDYLFTVVAQPSFEDAMVRARQAHQGDVIEYKALQKILAAGVGASKYPGQAWATSLLITQEEFDRAVTKVGGVSLEQYRYAQQGERINAVIEREQQGYYRRWKNLGWCGRRDLADKLAASYRGAACYAAVQIINAKKHA
jgi:hypothetical protein